jgi:diaminohydroxyphosphoribosylaminopyrimidine deaminase/5-amino-6-(5-phosphoribosylamino)uracil reductase
MADDALFMGRAMELAERGRGLTAPNPCVGAVLVREGRVVAEGWHTAWGKAHAEVEALRDAAAKGVDPRACTLYVTLEPCNHQGKTPPCTRAILEAGVPEVVVGCADPNATVAGGGAEFLRGRGVTVRTGVREEECRDLIADFLVWQTTQRPYSILKLATTLDGRIASRDGRAAWITGEASRREVHRLRAWCGAVIIGGGTYRADDPTLTCRLAVAVTRALPDPEARTNLLAARPGQTIFWTTETESGTERAARLADLGVAVWGLQPCGGDPHRGLDLAEGFRRLRGERGCHHALAEGGGRLAGALQLQGLVDELRLFQAMKVLGDEEGRPAFAGRGAAALAECGPCRLGAQGSFGTALFLRLRPRALPC